MASTDHSEAELQRAWRECALVGVTFQQAMSNPAMAITIHRLADIQRRRLARQQHDHKRAAANDID